MHFCPACETLLRRNLDSDDFNGDKSTPLVFLCHSCGYSREGDDSDTLIENVSLKQEQSMYRSEIYLSIATKDRLAPTIVRKCPQCNYPRSKQITLMDSGETVYICMKCQNKSLIK